MRETASLTIDARDWSAIIDFAARQQSSPLNILLASCQALFFRYAGEGTLLICTAAQKTNDSLAVPLFLRVHLTEGMTGEGLLRQASAALNEAEDCPFEQLVELWQERTHSIGTSACSTAFLYSRFPAGHELDGIAERDRAALASFLPQCDLVFYARKLDGGCTMDCEYDAELFEPSTVEKYLKHYRNLLLALVSNSQSSLESLPLLDDSEKQHLLVDWNDTQVDFAQDRCIHHLIEAQAARTPEAVAAIFEEDQFTYQQLNERANQVARHLRELGVGPETLVGLYTERSLEMLVGLLGILKAGGAYLPLDPTYPRERLAFMLADSQATVLLTQARLRDTLTGHTVKVVCLDSDWEKIAQDGVTNFETPVKPENLAYVIYTSGSTGKPKGVMVTHRNVVNFFAGMDRNLGQEQPGTWLAVTSICFDISVLELFWTLARGFKVVIAAGDDSKASPQASRVRLTKPLDFSLFFFSADEDGNPENRYHLLLEGAKFGDQNGFSAVWTPERHFHRFGGLYPNPSVTSAALATITSRVQLRAGSVVSPLHMPLRVAEEWAVVDNLSQGRIAISFASGWMPEDFVLQPQNYAERKEIMFRDIELVRRLWRGEGAQFPGPTGELVTVKISPQPVQSELPVWVTAAGNPETFEAAGTLQAGLLTHLLGQSIEEVATKVALYRKAWREAGHPGRGHVAIMLHTFVSESLEMVKETVRRPLTEYLRASADLIKKYSWAFSPFKTQGKTGPEVNFSDLPEADLQAVLDHAFARYFETSGLFGTPESCMQRLQELQGADIDEVACLIDFGVPENLVLENLPRLNSLREFAAQHPRPEPGKYSVPALIRRYHVTHIQCTPSMARMLLLDEEMKGALGGLQKLVLGGEALPANLAAHLQTLFGGEIINMYGPTETTVWSTCHKLLNGVMSAIPIGRPIANTGIYLLDKNLQPVPVGVEGELLIGGAGVARGYLNRPDLTAERFIQNPFNSDPKDRLYRTGDRARYLPDGKILYLGRMDHQVKIRGYRIEPGEIEAVLNEHSSVQASLVTAYEEASGNKKLVAYIIPREGEAAVEGLLRNHVKAKVPDYMVPAHVIFLKAFPQTPNGKIDRKALPAPITPVSKLPEQAASEPEAISDDSPQTPVEKALAGLWVEMLGLKKVSRHDNFFELGGHSLAAIQMISNIRQACEVDLPLQSLFRAPTLTALAEQLEKVFLGQAQAGDTSANEVALSPLEHQAAAGRPLSRRDLEKALSDLWAQALGIGKVGLEEDFFKLGGNSLLAIQLISRLEAVLRRKLSLRVLFDAPTVRKLAAQLATVETRPAPVERVSEQPLERLAPEPPKDSPQPIRPRQNRAEFPLSTGQKRLWFLHKLEGGCHYNEHFNLRLTGTVDVPVLEKAITEILRRHEVIRAAFTEVDGEPYQTILPLQRFVLPQIDLRSLPADAQLAEATRLAVEHTREPFDLANGNLWRFSLLTLSDTDHLLLIGAHHIAIDDWSRGIFLKELGALYPAFLAGQPSSLPESPIEYADYAVWHNEWLESSHIQEQLAYWKQNLAGAPPVLELPTDRPRPRIQSFRGARHTLQLPKPLTDKLRVLGQGEGATLFMALMAGFQTLLQRYTGQMDLVVGSPVANRPRPELDGVIGYFLNTLAFRGDLSGNPTFRQLLKRVREASLSGFENQDLPLERLIDALKPERNQSYSPLFQVLLVLHNAPMPALHLSGLALSPFEIDNGTTKFDLTLSLTETGEGISGWIEYAVDLFDAERMERLAGHLQTLLEGAVEEPDKPISELPLLTLRERQQMLEQWNPPGGDAPAGCVHELVEEQAKRTPNATALQYKGQQMSYAELNRKADRLADELQALGVKPDTLVGLCLERSPEMIVTVLGILKSGAAYLPLDPGYPAERLALILVEAKAPLVITQKSLRDRVNGISAKVVCLEELKLTEIRGDKSRSEKTLASHPNPQPENLAYCIFTSGSTGKPKGVAVEHRSVAALLAWAKRTFTPQELQAVLFSTSICFDVSVFEIFATLTQGGKLIIAENLFALPELPEAKEATLISGVPSAMAELLNAGALPASVQVVNLAGEPLSQTLVEKIYQSPSIRKVYDLYGPTEATVYATCCLRKPLGSETIGRPLGETQAFIADAKLHPLPVGVPGELLLGGPGLARGYLHQAELTAEKFIPNPFTESAVASEKNGGGVLQQIQQHSKRLYRTGDLARFLPDGNIEYLGRLDNQVKIRGFRIELGEIESVLAGYPGVRDCVVAVQTDAKGDKQLVAYVVGEKANTRTGGEPEAGGAGKNVELRQFLSKKLPEYMVPSAFVLLSSLPRLPNGKINRKALPMLGAASVESSPPNEKVAPRDGLEQRLTKIWEKVLGIRPIGIRDNFFDLGGHSFMAVRLFLEINKLSKRQLPLATLFQAPTVEQLASILRDQGSSAAFSSLVPIRPGGTRPALFCIHGGGGNVLLFQPLARYLRPEYPIYAFQSRGLDGKHNYLTSVEEMAACYLKELQEFQPEGPYYLSGFCMGGLIALEMAQQLRRQGHDVPLLVFFDTFNHSGKEPDLKGLNFFKVSREKAAFHWANIRPLPFREKLSYLKEKYLLAKDRELERWKLRLANIANSLAHRQERLTFLEDVNDKAAHAYKPQLYSGNVVLFRPQKNYTFMGDPFMGWKHLVPGGIVLQELPVYPGGLFTQPFVRVLAEKLQQVLDTEQK